MRPKPAGMKKIRWVVALLVATCATAAAQNNLSFTATYRDLGTKEESEKVVAGIPIVFPADQDDVVNLLEPSLAHYFSTRNKAAKEEHDALVEVLSKQRDVIENVITQLLGGGELSESFDSAFTKVIKQVTGTARDWRDWSGTVSKIHFYNHATAAPFRSSNRDVIEFPEIRYTYVSPNNANMALLPPFVSQYGTGIDKLRFQNGELKGFRCDVALFAAPGIQAEVIATEAADQFKTLADLQRKVAVQLGGKWIKRHIIETLLISEIQTRYLSASPDKAVISKALARYYLFVYLHSAEKDSLQVVLPNLFYIPFPSSDKQKFLDDLRTLDAFADFPKELEAAAARILFAALFRVSKDPNIHSFPLIAMDKHVKTWKGGKLTKKQFQDQLRETYPRFDVEIETARIELVQLIEKLAADQEYVAEEEEGLEDLILPDNYQTHKFGAFEVSGPKALEEAIKKLGPIWAEDLTNANGTLRKRFESKVVEPIAFSDEDYSGLSGYGFTIPPREVESWIMQTAAMANLAQVFVRLFSGNTAEIWIKEDLLAALRAQGKVRNFEIEAGGEKVSANFSIDFSPVRKEGESVSQWLDRFSYAEPPSFPVVITDAAIKTDPVATQIEKIKEADFLIGPLTEAADELTPELMTGTTFRFLSDEHCFFVVVHEVVEASLLKNTIGSRDRRWFCDGLANVIAIRECDRRFGSGSGMKVFHSLFPPENNRKLASEVHLLDWPVVGDSNRSVAEAEGLEGAHYFFSTLAIKAAIEGKDSTFIKTWLEEIQKTKWVRTNSSHVFAAYEKLTEEHLPDILKRMTEPE